MKFLYKNNIWRYWSAFILCIVGVGLAFYGNNIGVGLIIGSIITALIATIITLNQTENRIKKLEEEIEFLKKK
jgi:hypothetical protein